MQRNIGYDKQQALQALINQGSITPAGRDWLTLSLDPFHDFDHPIAGFPDADGSQTVVSCTQLAYDIAKPASVTTPGYNAHVFTLPILTALGFPCQYYVASAQGAHLNQGAVVPEFDLNTINICYSNIGAPLWPTTFGQVSDATYTVDRLMVPVSGPGVRQRVIGMGIEVVDTSAELYKQGACTVYQLPQAVTTAEVVVNSVAVPITYSTQVRCLAGPARTIEDAMLIGGTRQWDAAKGAYCCVRQSTTANPLVQCTTQQVAICSSDSGTGAEGLISEAVPFVANAPPAVSVVGGKVMAITPFNTSGIMLTNLNANSTFRLKVKVYVETAPMYWDSTLSVLATPSAPYDPVCLEIYSKALSMLPLGVEVSHNAFGDWWKSIMKVVGTIAAPIGVALNPLFPGAAAIGAGASAVAKLAGGRVITYAKATRVPTGENAFATTGTKNNDGVGQKRTLPITNRVQPERTSTAVTLVPASRRRRNNRSK